MRVLCINGDFSDAASRSGHKYIKQFPKEMESYHVTDILNYGPRGTGYVLEEVFGGFFPNGNVISWDSKRFALLEDSELECELEEELECLQLT